MVSVEVDGAWPANLGPGAGPRLADERYRVFLRQERHKTSCHWVRAEVHDYRDLNNNVAETTLSGNGTRNFEGHGSEQIVL